MIRIVQISILWIAGILILGHGIIPHHHHQPEQQQCATDHNTNNHNSEYFVIDCSCDSHESASYVCSIDVKTVIEKQQHHNLATHTGEIKLLTPERNVKPTLPKAINFIITDPLFERGPSRAPPIA